MNDAAINGTHAEARYIHPIRPEDGAELPKIKMASDAEVKKAVELARAAQVGWQALGLSERHARLVKAAKRMLELRAEALPILRDEVGKMEMDALMTEVLGPLDQVNAWHRIMKGHVHQKVALNPFAFPGKKADVYLVPRGVVGIIAPWNYPFATLFRSLIPALLSGNGVVLKPSEYATRTAQWFVQQLESFVTPNLIQVIPGDGLVGKALVESGIDACVFTGSVRAGREVNKACAERFIPVSVEMGGKDGAIVLADCDLDRTLSAITHWKLHNAGQACGAVEVAFVESSIADIFAQRIAAAFARMRVGGGPAGEVDVSPLSNARQVELVEKQVADAIKKGAKLLCGGKRTGKGFGFEPTVLDHCTEKMDVVSEETFGPLLPIVRVNGSSEAINIIHRNRYGLTASIFTSDIKRAERLAETIDVGVVTINNHAVTGAMTDLPWSGTKETGTGIANSQFALTTFMRPKVILVDKAKDPELFFLPYNKDLWEIGNLLSDAQRMVLGQAYKLPFLIKKRVAFLKNFYR